MSGPADAAGHHGPDEQVPLPLGEPVARVEGQAAGGDGRRPEDERLLHARRPEPGRHPLAVVLPPVGHDGPPVVLPRLDHVHLVPALHGVLGRQGGERLRVQGQPLVVPVPQREDLRQVALPADERVVVGHRAVVPQPQHLAGVAARVLGERLGRVGAEGAADGQVQRAVGREPHAGPRRRPPERLGHEHVLDIAQGHAVEPPPDEGDGRLVVRQRPGVAEVDEPVLVEVRMERHVHQAGEASGEHRRHPGDGLGVEHPVADHPERPEIALGDEDAPVGQERHAPRTRQPFRHHHHPDLRDRMGVDDERLVRHRDAREAGRLGLGLFLLRGGE